jgi:hypothetical protein
MEYLQASILTPIKIMVLTRKGTTQDHKTLNEKQGKHLVESTEEDKDE